MVVPGPLRASGDATAEGSSSVGASTCGGTAVCVTAASTLGSAVGAAVAFAALSPDRVVRRADRFAAAGAVAAAVAAAPSCARVSRARFRFGRSVAVPSGVGSAASLVAKSGAEPSFSTTDRGSVPTDAAAVSGVGRRRRRVDDVGVSETTVGGRVDAALLDRTRRRGVSSIQRARGCAVGAQNGPPMLHTKSPPLGSVSVAGRFTVAGNLAGNCVASAAASASPTMNI